MTMRQPKCGTDARCEGYWTDCGYPSDEVPELVSGDNIIFSFKRITSDNLISLLPKAWKCEGLLITLEGIDGSGKSTAAKHIASKLQRLMPERRLVLTAEPTTGEVGRILRAELRKRGAATRPLPPAHGRAFSFHGGSCPSSGQDRSSLPGRRVQLSYPTDMPTPPPPIRV